MSVKMKRFEIYLDELTLKELDERAKDFGIGRSSMVRADVMRANREYNSKKNEKN